MGKQPWGIHLVVDAKGCDLESIQSKENITEFAKTLVKEIDMVAYGEPQVIHFGKDDKTGYTLVQLIETSNICAHFCDVNGDAYFDIFSCKHYEQDTVINVIERFFGPSSYSQIRLIERE